MKLSLYPGDRFRMSAEVLEPPHEPAAEQQGRGRRVADNDEGARHEPESGRDGRGGEGEDGGHPHGVHRRQRQ